MRNWTQAKQKIEEERRCRICSNKPEPAHIIPRSRIPGPEAMDARNIVPLCRQHHTEYDSHTLDLLPYLSHEEQSFAVQLVGMHEAYKRIINGQVFN